jgi:hypothetical protein
MLSFSLEVLGYNLSFYLTDRSAQYSAAHGERTDKPLALPGWAEK